MIRAGATLVQIQPKFLRSEDDESWLPALWEILMLADPRAHVMGAVGSDNSKNGPADLLAQTFLRSLAQTAISGLPRGYLETSESLPVLRGSLDQSRVERLLVDPFLVPCVFDSYEEDIPINRLLRWATETLGRLVVSPRLAAELREAGDHFIAVSGLPPTAPEADRIVVPAVYRHLEPAVDLARILLAQSRLVHGSAHQLALGFLWKSHAVFERVIEHLLRRAAPNLGASLSRTQQVLAERIGPGRAIRTRPDVRLVRSGRTRLVIDAKYKLLTPGESPHPDDVYQVIAGAALNGTTDAVLAYPARRREAGPIAFETLLRSTPKRLSLVFIDLLEMGKPDGEAVLVTRLENVLGPMVDRAELEDQASQEATMDGAIQAKLASTEAAAAFVPPIVKRDVENQLSKHVIPAAWERLSLGERRLVLTPFVLEHGLQIGELETRTAMDWSGLVLGPLAAIESVLLRILVLPCKADAPEILAPIVRGALTLGTGLTFLREASKGSKKGIPLRTWMENRAGLDAHALLEYETVVRKLEQANGHRREAAHSSALDRKSWDWVLREVVGVSSDSGLLSRMTSAHTTDEERSGSPGS
jgi:5-methylcytosine-specific restriction endonuclease McrBC regulatory subunit McrC